MNESPNKHAVIVGIFVFIGLAFLMSGILIVGNLRNTFNRKMKLVALFDDVGGLTRGNNVWYSGVKIGSVSSMDFFGESQVEVGLNIETKARQYIRKDAKVKISSDGFIGNKILVIYGGSQQSDEVQEGDTLGVEKSFSSEDMINTFQDNNKNLLAITNDFKIISRKLASGEGTIGKLLNDSSVYENIDAATASLKDASVSAQQLAGSLAKFSSGLTVKGTLANDLITDTLIFSSVKASVLQLQRIADTAAVFITNLKLAGSNPNSPIGVLLLDDEAGARIKETIKNLESSSVKLDEDLEAAQHKICSVDILRRKQKLRKVSHQKNRKTQA